MSKSLSELRRLKVELNRKIDWLSDLYNIATRADKQALFSDIEAINKRLANLSEGLNTVLRKARIPSPPRDE